MPGRAAAAQSPARRRSPFPALPADCKTTFWVNVVDTKALLCRRAARAELAARHPRRCRLAAWCRGCVTTSERPLLPVRCLPLLSALLSPWPGAGPPLLGAAVAASPTRGQVKVCRSLPHPGDNTQPVAGPEPPSLLFPGAFPVVPGELPSRGCVSSPELGVALPRRNAIRLRPFSCELEPVQEQDGIPGRSRPAALTCVPPAPQMPGDAGSEAVRLELPLPWNGQTLLSPSAPVPAALAPSDVPSHVRPPRLCAIGFPLCQAGQACGRAVSFAGSGDAGTASAVVGEPCPAGHAAGGCCAAVTPWCRATPCSSSKGLAAGAAPRAHRSDTNSSRPKPSPRPGRALSPAALRTLAAVENFEFCCQSGLCLLVLPLQVGGCPAPPRPRPRGTEGMLRRPEGWDGRDLL